MPEQRAPFGTCNALCVSAGQDIPCKALSVVRHFNQPFAQSSANCIRSWQHLLSSSWWATLSASCQRSCLQSASGFQWLRVALHSLKLRNLLIAWKWRSRRDTWMHQVSFIDHPNNNNITLSQPFGLEEMHSCRFSFSRSHGATTSRSKIPKAPEIWWKSSVLQLAAGAKPFHNAGNTSAKIRWFGTYMMTENSH